MQLYVRSWSHWFDVGGTFVGGTIDPRSIRLHAFGVI